MYIEYINSGISQYYIINWTKHNLGQSNSATIKPNKLFTYKSQSYFGNNCTSRQNLSAVKNSCKCRLQVQLMYITYTGIGTFRLGALQRELSILCIVHI